MKDVIQEISNGVFGEPSFFQNLIQTIINEPDKNLICEEFEEYLVTQFKVDQLFQSSEEWTKRSLKTALRVSGFTSDRAVSEYAENVWFFN